MARPTNLTEPVLHTLTQAARERTTVGERCRRAGVHPATYRRWLHKGRRGGGGRAQRLAETLDDLEASDEAACRQSADARIESLKLPLNPCKTTVTTRHVKTPRLRSQSTSPSVGGWVQQRIVHDYRLDYYRIVDELLRLG